MEELQAFHVQKQQDILALLLSSDCWGYGILGHDTEVSCRWIPTLWRKTLTPPWARNRFSYRSIHRLQGRRDWSTVWVNRKFSLKRADFSCISIPKSNNVALKRSLFLFSVSIGPHWMPFPKDLSGHFPANLLTGHKDSSPYTLKHWRWRRNVPSRWRHPLTWPHGVISQNIKIWTEGVYKPYTAMRYSSHPCSLNWGIMYHNLCP
jgi:hypothetical protein